MTQIKPALLSAAQSAALLTAANAHLSQFMPSHGVFRRMGINGVDALSEYEFLKRWKFPDALNQVYEQQVPEALRQSSNEVWLLRFPTGGFLDQYRASKPLFNCLSIPLNDGGQFTIWENGAPVTHTNKAGDGYLFSLADYHQVPPATQDELYLCFLFLNHIEVMNNA